MPSTLFTNRNGGVSSPPYATNNLAFHVGDERGAVLHNRELAMSTFAPTIYMNQRHGDRVVLVDGIPSQEADADALVTQTPDIALAVLVADCIPLLLWDAAHTCVAVVHVGRRGLVNGISEKTVGIMRALGAGQIHALLGPSICGRCYEVGEDVHDGVVSVIPAAKSRTRLGALALNLPGALSGQLEKMGAIVTASNICTVESQDLFSYRRDGSTGRQAGMIRL